MSIFNYRLVPDRLQQWHDRRQHAFREGEEPPEEARPTFDKKKSKIEFDRAAFEQPFRVATVASR